jgi:hypothetical protein
MTFEDMSPLSRFPAFALSDLFRKKKPESFSDAAVGDEDGELLQIEDLLPSPDAGPEALYARNVRRPGTTNYHGVAPITPITLSGTNYLVPGRIRQSVNASGVV